MAVIKNRYKTIPILVLAMLMQTLLHAQISEKYRDITAEARMLMQSGNYYHASQILGEVLNTDSSDLEVAYLYAESKRQFLSYRKANHWYQYVYEHDKLNEYPEALYYLAITDRYLGKYSDAGEHFRKYRIYAKKKGLPLKKIDNEIAACEFALAHISDSLDCKIEHLPTPVNTEYSEFNPVPYSSSELVFSRYRNIFHDSIDGIFSNSYISDIMVSKLSERGWSKPKVFEKRFQSPVDFAANICFSHNKRLAFYSICKDYGGQVGNCAIYRSDYKNGKWTKPKRLNDDINLEGYSSTQPFLAEGKDFDVLYFSSNRPGGQGGMDLWYVVIKDGKYQKVTNLGSIINTPGSELSPSYDSDSMILYFSSDWHPGFGGFDIFKSKGGLASWTKPENMHLPINSSSNDLYYITRPSTREAWFSSNRSSSFHSKNAENCCSDIYYISFEEKSIHQENDTSEIPIAQTDSIEKKIQQLLPLTLYFHNDIPDPGSTSPTTDANYKDLLDDYFKLEDKYKKEYAKGLKGEQAEQARDDIEDFFQNYVAHGFEDLEELASLLKRELEEGKDIRLKIRGYASPLNTPEYNLNLSKRRIASLINYLKEYDNGYFLPYFKGTAENGGSITIYKDPMGDSQAADFVSDNPNDKRNSVYSRAAAMERRIQIILYSSGNTLQQDIQNKEFPILQISNIHKLGQVKSGERKVVKISIKNTGKSELNIQSITADCTCIRIQLKQRSLQPGESGIIYLLIEADELSPGTKTFTLDIRSNTLEKEKKVQYSFEVF